MYHVGGRSYCFISSQGCCGGLVYTKSTHSCVDNLLNEK